MEKTPATHVEELEDLKDASLQKTATMGTVKLNDGAVVYVPTPTSDPRDPLNMERWQKYAVLVILSVFSCLGLSLVAGFGSLLPFYIPVYAAKGATYADITHLMTYPTLFMGLGNLIGMPIALAVGRRIVLLGATTLLVVATILCACATTFEWHLGARMILGLAAGQSEAIVPMVVQECFFLHERSHFLMVQQFIQIVLCTVWIILASPISQGIGPKWWYLLGAFLAIGQLVAAIVFLPETKYIRSLASFQEDTSSQRDDSSETAPNHLCTTKPALDFVRFKPRTRRSDMRLWVDKPDWKKIPETFIQCFELCLFPNVFWALCINGLTIGVNIAIGTTYSAILGAAPYNWPNSSISYVNCGQIVVALVALPLNGYGSDLLVKWRAKRNGGIHEPEVRLIPLWLPIIVGTFSTVLYGQGAVHPQRYHWFLYVWVVAGQYFAFVGANIVAITYLLDSYPARAGPLLVIICAFRGIISFGVSYGIAPFTQNAGFDGAFGAFGGLTAFLGLMAIPVYFLGKRIRGFTGRFAKSEKLA